MKPLHATFLVLAALIALFAAPVARAQIVAGGGFESPVIGTFQSLPSTSASQPWTFSGNSGISSGIWGSIGFGMAGGSGAQPNGQFAFLQAGMAGGTGAGGAISQTVTLSAPGTYSLTYMIGGRDPNSGGTGTAIYSVTISGGLLSATGSSVSSQVLTAKSHTFAVSTAGTYTLSFTNTSLVGDGTAYVDVVAINPPPIGSITATYNSAADVPVTSFGATLSGGTAALTLGYAPVAGTELMVVKNTGLGFITGTFSNLAQGQAVALSFAGAAYDFIANYYGGTGNDLVLQWANVRPLAWGNNSSGELGNNSTAKTMVPVAVQNSGVLAGKSVTALAAGENHSLALCSDGTVAAWGSNASGQLGNNSKTVSIVPVAVDRSGLLAGKRVIALAAGKVHSLALCSDGTVAAWGSDASGQLGNNSTADSLVPVAVDRSGALSGKSVIALAAAHAHSLAVCSDGTVIAWGDGSAGALGNNSANGSMVPVEVDRSGVLAGKSVIAVSGGQFYSLVLCSDGTLAGWGRNYYGQLGNNNTADSSVPVLVDRSGVLAGKSVIALSAGYLHSLAICADGTVAAWGFNGNGELGNNNSTPTSTVPVLVDRSGVLAGKSVIAVSAGFSYSLALCADGTVAAWGHNNESELGNNSTTSSPVPVAVSTTALAAGERFSLATSGSTTLHNLALVASGPPVPAVAATAASSLTAAAATLNGTVSANGFSTAVTFSYGLTTAYGTDVAATPTPVTGSSATAVSAPLTGLAAHTAYHFRVNGVSSAGTSNGADATFTTLNSTPVATTPSATTTNEDTLKAINLAGTDPDGDALTFDIVSQPAHGSVTLLGNTVTYTPAQDYNGSDSFTFTASDAFGGTSAAATVSLTVTVGYNTTIDAITKPAAILVNAGLQTVNFSGVTASSGQLQALTVTATSDNPALIPNPTVSYTAPASSGSLSYAPVANASGTAVITVLVSDGASTATNTFLVTVVAPLSDVPVYSVNPAIYTKGSAIGINTPAPSGGTPVSWSLTGTLPAGLFFSTSTGAISGTPTATAAATNYLVRANYAGGPSAPVVLTITVNDTIPVIASLDAFAVVGVNFSYQIVASNSPASYTVSNLPGGLKLDATRGIISGIPLPIQPGDSPRTLTLTATNAKGTGTAAVTLTIAFNPVIIANPVSHRAGLGDSVRFDVTAAGSGVLQYKWRKEGVEIKGANQPVYLIKKAALADAGSYDVSVSNADGVSVTSAAALLQVDSLSQFAQRAPDAATDNHGVVLVNLSPLGIGAAWRFLGEQSWRAPGSQATGVASGNRQIEFRPVQHYHAPRRELVEVDSGGDPAEITREYYEDVVTASGALKVTLKPDAVAAAARPEEKRAQWRILDQGDASGLNPWQNSGATLMELPSGSYLIECKPIAGQTTPPPLSVTVSDAVTSSAEATYFLAEGLVGVPPVVLAAQIVTESAALPYQYVGQIRSDAGVSTGFAVKARVVATAGHVVFDDAKLTAQTLGSAPLTGAQLQSLGATGLQWLFERDQGTYEPTPQIPRGYYLLSGYAEKRIADHTVGESTSAARNLDVAALYFLKNAARGGYSGFVASAQTDNEFLISSALKTMAGYPVDGIPVSNQGRMHATPIANVALTRVQGVDEDRVPYQIYTTSDITSFGGNSGGPLCVQFEGGSYYPAAIYLGGSNQTVVRAIDSDVVDLFKRAEVSSAGGNNFTGGGVTQVNSATAAPALKVAGLKVIIEPAEARGAGARWKLKGGASSNESGTELSGQSNGIYNLQLTPVTGFETPATPSFILTEGTVVTKTYTYAKIARPALPSSMSLRGIRNVPFAFIPAVSGGGAKSFAATPGSVAALASLDLAFDQATGKISGTPSKAGSLTVVLTASNSSGTSDPLVLTLAVADSVALKLEFDSSRGSVTGSPAPVQSGNNTLGAGVAETLIARPKSLEFIFAGWTLAGAASGAEPVTSLDPKLALSITEAATATANFVPSPYPAFADAYGGRIVPTSGAMSVSNTGTMRLSLAKLGEFTGKFQIGTATYSFKGQLGPDGTAPRLVIKQAKLDQVVLDALTLDLATGGSEQITGRLKAGGAVLSFALDRAVFDSKAHPCPQSQLDPKTQKWGPAQYTLALQHETGSPAGRYPGGHGFGVAIVKPDGTVRFAGTLGDGTPIVQSSMVSKAGLWPFHALLYKNGGLLTGGLLFRDTPAVSDLDGPLDWIKPALPGVTTTYSGGFTDQLNALGSRYDKQAQSSFENGSVIFGSGGIAAPRAVVISDPVTGFVLRFTSASGLFQGTFIEAGTAKPRPFYGAVVQKAGRGFGMFIGAPLPRPASGFSSGYVELSP